MAGPLILLLRGIRQVGLRPTWDGVAYALRSRWAEARFADRQHPRKGLSLLAAFLRRLSVSPAAFPPAGPVVAIPGPLQAYRCDGQILTFTLTPAHLILTVVAPDLIRVCFTLQEAQEPGEEPESPCPFDVVETPQAVEVRTERVNCAVSRADGRLAFRDPVGNLIAEEVAPVGWTADGRVVSRWAVGADAHFYGLGQRAANLDRRGGSYVNWNTDPRTYDPGDDPLDLCIPFLLALDFDGRQGYALLLENAACSRFDLGQLDPGSLTLEVEDRNLRYSFFYGPDLTTVIARYTGYTGRHPLFPLWVLGYHQSRWSYFPQERVRRLAEDFRNTYQVPCDAIHLDIHYMDGCRCFTWDPQRFPDPAGLIADLHAQGFKVVTIIDPGIKADPHYRVFRAGLEQDAFCRYPDGRLFIGPVWPGNCAFPDFTSPRVRVWWGDLHRDLVSAGVDGIWNDMNEPSVFGEDGATIPGPVLHQLEGQGGDHRQAHNLYGLRMVQATAEGLARLMPDRRPFIFTRSGWTGVQRYGANWTGDNRSSWESLRLTLPMVLGLGLSGIAFTGADVGGFSGFSTGELFTRWLQMGAFLPLFRAHTEISSPDQEPWSWGEPYLSINRQTIRWRYRLLAYLYTALWQCTQTGLPIARALCLAYQNDPLAHTLDDEFLCGDALLVAPVLEEGARRRRVYLPAGDWIDFWTDACFRGPTHLEVEAPLERIPVFVRSGSVVPMIPAMDYVGQRPWETIEVHLYPGQGVSWLYEDDGVSLAYRGGQYRLTRFVLEASSGRLDLIRKVQGAFDPGYSCFEIVVHGVQEVPHTVEGIRGAETAYDPQGHVLRLRGGAFERLSVRW